MNSFVTTLDDGWAKHPNNVRTSKTFVNFISSGIPCKERGFKPRLNTVVQLYKNFTADCGTDVVDEGGLIGVPESPDAAASVRVRYKGNMERRKATGGVKRREAETRGNCRSAKVDLRRYLPMRRFSPSNVSINTQSNNLFSQQHIV